MEFQRTEDSTADRRKRTDQGLDYRRDPRYHVYIRLPFNRGSFVDPGTVNWDEKKSEALWSHLSGSSLDDVDWTKLAAQFDVTVDFLLHMTNYLTERHASQLRAKVWKAAVGRGSTAPSPVPDAEPPKRTSSGAGRAPSALSIRKDTATPLPASAEEHGGASTGGPPTKANLPIRPESSRNSSAPTPVPPQYQLGSRPGTAGRVNDAQKRRLSYLPSPGQQHQQPPQHQPETELPQPSPTDSSTSSLASSSDSAVESRIIRRPPRFQSSKDTRAGGNNHDQAFDGDDDPDDDDDEDDAEPAFLPFKRPNAGSHGAAGSSSSGAQDLTATLRGNMRDLVAGRRTATDAAAPAAAPTTAAASTAAHQSQTSDSSVGSSAVVAPRRPPANAGGGASGGRAGAGERQTAVRAAQQQGQGPLSPRRAAELAGRGLTAAGGGARAKGTSRDGSDGTPSMGSSFSDLDDASVTQSALEEALSSRMQDGTIGSRMSVIGGTLGQAIRSRYLPKSNR